MPICFGLIRKSDFSKDFFQSPVRLFTYNYVYMLPCQVKSTFKSSEVLSQ